MNIYDALNEITLYIENHIEEKIDVKNIAKIMGTSPATMKSIFNFITGISLIDYIRNRKLSCAAYDILTKKEKIMDVAIKYGYENGTTFSRAFTKFHGVKPSQIKTSTKIKDFPRIVYNTKINKQEAIEYSIIELPTLTLYGTYIKTSNKTIGQDAPVFFSNIKQQYEEKYGPITYAMITYDKTRDNCQKYYCLFPKNIPNFEKITIPSSKWLKFSIYTREAKEIQKMSHRFYNEFLKSAKYTINNLPELEYYHENKTDFLVPIN